MLSALQGDFSLRNRSYWSEFAAPANRYPVIHPVRPGRLSAQLEGLAVTRHPNALRPAGALQWVSPRVSLQTPASISIEALTGSWLFLRAQGGRVCHRVGLQMQPPKPRPCWFAGASTRV